MPGRVVDPRYVPFNVTTASGVLRTAPTSTVVPVPHARLLEVEVIIPPGHAGVTGLQLVLAGSTILPFTDGDFWLQGDDLDRIYDFDVEVDTGLTVRTWNQGAYPHTHFLRFKVEAIDKPNPLQPVQLAPI